MPKSLRASAQTMLAVAFLLPSILLPTKCASLSTDTAPFRPPTVTAQSIREARAPKSAIDEVRNLAAESSTKILGSDSYRRAWKRWSQFSLESIQSNLANSLPTPVDYEATDELTFELGLAADFGHMPSFGHEGARAGYALAYFCRARLLSDVMFAARTVSRKERDTEEKGNAATATSFFGDCVEEFFVGGERDVCRIGSLGGGPGYDFVAAALLATHGAYEKQAQLKNDDGSIIPTTATTTTTKIHTTVFDYEEGWSQIIPHMEGAVQSTLGRKHICDFSGCDITLPLTDPTNSVCQSMVDNADVWICSYCVAENAVRLRNSDYIFFDQLFQQSRDGVVFIFTETTHRLWPEIADVALRKGGHGTLGDAEAAEGFDVVFPRGRLTGKAGFQMALRKRPGAKVGSNELELCRKFRRDNEMHERKISGGWTRQKRKIRGAK